MELFNPIPQEVTNKLLDRLANEYEAHYFYRNAANWCDNIGYTNAAAFFKNEASDELTHANKLQKFLNDWGIYYTIPSVSVSPTFRNLPDVIDKAYGIEVALYQAYNLNAEEVEEVDKSVYSLLLEMVDIQYNSVAEYRTFIDKLRLINDADKFQVMWFENEIFGE
jgi:ferritin